MELIDTHPTPSERRSFRRKACHIPLGTTGIIKDLSVGGAFLDSAQEMDSNKEIPVSFNLNGGSRPVIAQARVVNQRPHGFGLQFTDIDISSRLNIMDFLSERDFPSNIESEFRSSLGSFIKSWTTQYDLVTPEFKKEISDFRLYLNQLKKILDTEERKLSILSMSEKEKVSVSIMEFYEAELQAKVHQMLLNINEVIRDFTENEHTLHRSYFQEQLLDLTNDSIFLNRAMTKPLGYAGDYMMMEYLYHGLRAGKTLWQKIINSCFTSIPLGQAVRNRAWYLSEQIGRHLDTKSRPNIMSLACGPCEEVAIVLEKKLPPASYFLIDQDQEAVRYAQDKIRKVQFKSKVEATIDFRLDAVKAFLKDPNIVNQYPKMDLIYSAGLYDYLKAPVAAKLTSVLAKMLKPGGELILGNFTRGPFSYFIEYASDWYLINRTREEMMDLVSPEDSNLFSQSRIDAESGDVNLFLCLCKF